MVILWDLFLETEKRSRKAGVGWGRGGLLQGDRSLAEVITVVIYQFS